VADPSTRADLSPASRSARAPGRCTIVGDHTDYSFGRSLTAALPLGTTVTFAPGGAGLLEVSTTLEELPLRLELPAEPGSFPPGSLGRLLAGLLAGFEDPARRCAGRLSISGDLPVGAGLSSSASLLIAASLALGVNEPLLDLARRCSRAEDEAGQVGGLLDQLAILTGATDQLSLLDFSRLSWRRVPMPDAAELNLVHSGETRVLAESRYAERRAQCHAAEDFVGPLAEASLADLDRIADPLLRARARHVLSENARVDEAVRLLEDEDLTSIGALMDESHRSLSQDFGVSTPGIDALQARLRATPGVLGARLVGGGFGGCVVVLSTLGALEGSAFGPRWTVRPSAAARLL
jgi:galactokinase